MSQENVEIVQRYFDLTVRRIDPMGEPRPIADAMEADELDPESRSCSATCTLTCAGPRAGCRLSRSARLRARRRSPLGGVAELSSDRSGGHRPRRRSRSRRASVGIRGKASGASASQAVYSLNRLHGGLIVRADEYLDRAEALKAVGLEE